MSLARAVTKRIKRAEASPSVPTRSQSMKQPNRQIDMSRISSPVALLSTTNSLAYNAPDIATLRHASSSTKSSTQSADDSDHSDSTSRSRSSSHASRDTLTDASSVDSSPTSPAPNHLSGYFPAPKAVRRSASSGNLPKSKTDVEDSIPAIPERALSHSKRAHERLARNRSLQNMNTTGRGSLRSNRSSREHRASVDMFRATIEEESHPFGKELEQLNEVAEEFGGVVRDAEMEADMTVIREKGLATFCAADYLQEIQPLFSTRFGNPFAAKPLAWI